MGFLSNISRSEGDPKIVHSGPSSLGAPDRLARALGWFSIGLGLAELLAPRRFTRALGMPGQEMLVQGYGLREISSGVLSLSPDKTTGLWSRVGGDALDMLTLATAYRADNPKRGNVAIALVAVAGITLIDLIGAQGVTSRHRRTGGDRRRYSDRSGFPQGLKRARGAALRDPPSSPDRQAAATSQGGESAASVI